MDDFVVGAEGTQGIDSFALSINGELIPGLEELEDSLGQGPKRVDAFITLIQCKRSPSFNLGDLSVFVDTAFTLMTSDTPYIPLSEYPVQC